MRARSLRPSPLDPRATNTGSRHLKTMERKCEANLIPKIQDDKPAMGKAFDNLFAKAMAIQAAYDVAREEAKRAKPIPSQAEIARLVKGAVAGGIDSPTIRIDRADGSTLTISGGHEENPESFLDQCIDAMSDQGGTA